MKKREARALVALATEVHHSARRLETLKTRRVRGAPTRKDRKPWTKEQLQAEIDGQKIRQTRALEGIMGLIVAVTIGEMS